GLEARAPRTRSGTTTPAAPRSMRILMVSAEYAPLAKTGGLADAVAGLADALATRGHDVRTIMPGYGRPLPTDYRETSRERIGGAEHVVARHAHGGPTLGLVEADEIGHDGCIYAGDDRDAAR